MKSEINCFSDSFTTTYPLAEPYLRTHQFHSHSKNSAIFYGTQRFTRALLMFSSSGLICVGRGNVPVVCWFCKDSYVEFIG
jgi:hypothetical protein